MAKAIWNDTVIAESDQIETVEGNAYFPPESLHDAYFKPSNKTTFCGWKGTANYLTVTVNGQDNPDAAWVYKDPKPEASHIKGHVAFWKGVVVEQ